MRKSSFPKMCHYAGFSQIESHTCQMMNIHFMQKIESAISLYIRIHMYDFRQCHMIR